MLRKHVGLKRFILLFILFFFIGIVSKGTSGEEKVPEKIYTNSMGMRFVYIPPGTFIMGSPPGEPGRNNDETRHQVTLTKGFYIQAREVTQKQWKAVMGKNPSLFINCGDDCPVEQVKWNTVQEFIIKLNRLEGSDKYRLPTEAEWEYACRAGSTTRFYFGDDEEKLPEYAWYGRDARGRTHPVGRKKPNAWGLYDMHGNVWEWCQDWYGDYPNRNIIDPKGPSSGDFRVLRGGAWYDLRLTRYFRSADRVCKMPKDSLHAGFRLVRDF